MPHSKKRFIVIPASVLLIISSVIAIFLSSNKSNLFTMEACVIEVYETSALVYVKQTYNDETTWTLGTISTDRQNVKLLDTKGKTLDKETNLKAGQMIKFKYPGIVQEMYPARYVDVSLIQLLNEENIQIYNDGAKIYNNFKDETQQILNGR